MRNYVIWRYCAILCDVRRFYAKICDYAIIIIITIIINNYYYYYATKGWEEARNIAG